jgi:hypothetical protein
MAKEILNLEVKSNVKSVTQETKDWGKTLDDVNKEISIQNEEIVRQERLLIKLKAKQDAIPKGGWVAGMDKLNDKIRKTSDLINLEKNTLKELTNKQKEANQEIRKSTAAKKGNNKESKESITNFQVMGVSLSGIKKGFGQIIPTAKGMFGTIRAGIMSTGIGALVIAVVALMQSFKRSEEGQERFQRIMAAIGAVTSQVLDAFAELGEIIIDTFQDPLPAMKTFGKGLLKFLRDPTGATRDMFIKAALSAKDFVDETTKEVDALIEVTNMRQKAHHIDRKLKVERAKANREINDIRLKAEDREKNNATARIALLRKAQAIEEGITAKEIKSKKLLIDAQKLEMKQGLNTIEDKDKLAQLQAELINLDTKKLRSQRLLQTQITTAVNEEKAIKEKAKKDAQKIIDDEFDAKIKANDEWNKEQIKTAKESLDREKAISNAKVALAQNALLLIGTIAGEGTALAKGTAIAQATMSGIEGVQNAYTTAQKSPLTALFPGYPLVQAGLAGAFSALQLAKIAGVGAGGGGGGGGVVGGTSTAPPAPQMMSGAFELTGGQAVEPTRAYVVSDDITASQNALAIIRRRATI